jgi:hypothetical protein
MGHRIAWSDAPLGIVEREAFGWEPSDRRIPDHCTLDHRILGRHTPTPRSGDTSLKVQHNRDFRGMAPWNCSVAMAACVASWHQQAQPSHRRAWTSTMHHGCKGRYRKTSYQNCGSTEAIGCVPPGVDSASVSAFGTGDHCVLSC